MPVSIWVLQSKGLTQIREWFARRFLAKGIQYAPQLALQNVQALLQIVEWNAQHWEQFGRIKKA
jgi:UV DNA damage endonuclease